MGYEARHSGGAPDNFNHLFGSLTCTAIEQYINASRFTGTETQPLWLNRTVNFHQENVTPNGTENFLSLCASLVSGMCRPGRKKLHLISNSHLHENVFLWKQVSVGQEAQYWQEVGGSERKASQHFNKGTSLVETMKTDALRKTMTNAQRLASQPLFILGLLRMLSPLLPL